MPADPLQTNKYVVIKRVGHPSVQPEKETGPYLMHVFFS